MRRRRAIGSSVETAWPATRASPLVGSTRRLNSRNRVVLPLPLSPTSARVSPAATVRLTPARARVPSPHTLTASTTSSAATGVSAAAGIRVIYPARLRQLGGERDGGAQRAMDGGAGGER